MALTTSSLVLCLILYGTGGSACAVTTTITESDTYVYTNQYTTQYSSDVTCKWYVTAPIGQCPTVTFLQFSTEQNYDFFDVYDSSSSTLANRMSSNQGNSLPSAVRASQRFMTLVFTSDNIQASTGVVAEISFSSCYSATSNVGACSSSSIVSSGTLKTNPTGTLYANNANCVWSISSPSGQCPRLSFTTFTTESVYDKFFVYDGTSTSNRILLSASGTVVPSPVLATQQNMYVQFTSDGTINYAGVQAQISSVQCTATVTPNTCSTSTNIATSGTYIKTNPTSTVYSSSMTCTWYIASPVGNCPSITFSQFNTESTSDRTA